MQLSSNNLLKRVPASQVTQEKEIVTIVKEKETQEVKASIGARATVNEMTEYMQAQQDKLEKIRQEMISEVQKETKEIERVAYEKGYQEGMKKGETVGYQEGLSLGKKEAATYTKLAKQNLVEAHQAIKESMEEQKKALVQFSLSLAEKLTETVIDREDEIIVKKITNFIEEINYPQELLIVRVHPTKFDSVREAIASKKDSWAHSKISIFKEGTLNTFDFSIETETDFTLFDLKQEISIFLEKLMRDDL